MNAMMRATFIALLAVTAADAARRWGGQRASLSLARAEPSSVAHILVEVEQRWEQWALATADCGTHPLPNCTINATGAKDAFKQSCATVSRAVIQSSAGDKTRVQSYMVDVCQQDDLKGDKAELCLDYAQMLAQGMSEFQHENTEEKLDLESMCLGLFEHGYLGTKITKEAARRQQEVDARAAEEQAKADAIEAARLKAEADAKAAAARKHLQEVANATAVATRKREQAVQAAVAAQRKADEVDQAEEVSRRLQAEAAQAAKEAEAAASTATKAPAGNRSTFVQVRKSFLATFPVTFS